MEQMAREDDGQPANTPCRGRDDRVIPRHMRMNNVESSILQSGAQAQSAHTDIRIQRTILTSGKNDAMPALSKRNGQFENMSFTAANRFCRINLQNAHC